MAAATKSDSRDGAMFGPARLLMFWFGLLPNIILNFLFLKFQFKKKKALMGFWGFGVLGPRMFVFRDSLVF